MSRLRGLGADGVRVFRSWSPLKQVAAIVAAIAFVVAVVTVDIPDVSTLRSWAEHLGPWFPVTFWLGYVFISQFPIPRTVLSIAAGILFGPWLGLALALSATTVAAAVSLVVVRSFLQEWIAPRLTHPAVVKINDHLRREGLIAIISLRMIAGVPFSIMNYVAAISNVRLGVMALGTLIGSAPGTALIVVFGDSLTGTPSLGVLVAMGALAICGLSGVALDTRAAVKAPR